MRDTSVPPQFVKANRLDDALVTAIDNPPVNDRLVEMGRLGRKRGKGWYRYDARTPTPGPEINTLIRSLATEAGIPQREIGDREIVDRSIPTLVNDGARARGDGLAARALDIDVICVTGYGFPAWRGGAMFCADRLGLGQVLDRIRAFHRDRSGRWRPAPLLAELASRGQMFREWDRAGR